MFSSAARRFILYDRRTFRDTQDLYWAPGRSIVHYYTCPVSRLAHVAECYVVNQGSLFLQEGTCTMMLLLAQMCETSSCFQELFAQADIMNRLPCHARPWETLNRHSDPSLLVGRLLPSETAQDCMATVTSDCKASVII